MDPREWILEFRALHAKARKKELAGEALKAYLEAREHLARSLCAAQGLSLKPGDAARQTFRVSHAMQVELQLVKGPVRAAALDISRGGFSTLVVDPPQKDELIGYSLKLPGGGEPLVGRAKVISLKKQIGNHRVSFEFDKMSEADGERLEIILFDSALARLP